MATIKTHFEDGTTVFDVTWKDPDVVGAMVCQRSETVFHYVADAVSSRKLSKRARARPWSMILEFSRKDICDQELDDYFAGLADVLYRALLDADPDADIPESIEIAWPASTYEGVYRSMTYSPAYEDDSE